MTLGWSHSEAKERPVEERLLERCAAYSPKGLPCPLVGEDLPAEDWCERCLAAVQLMGYDSPEALEELVAPLLLESATVLKDWYLPFTPLPSVLRTVYAQDPALFREALECSVEGDTMVREELLEAVARTLTGAGWPLNGDRWSEEQLQALVGRMAEANFRWSHDSFSHATERSTPPQS